MKTIGVFTSGGDAPGMNACLRAVVRYANGLGMGVAGIRRGYAGLLEGDIIRLGPRDVANIIQRGGTFLQTSRCPEMMTVEGRSKAIQTLRNEGIDTLIALGGEGTFHAATLLTEEGGIEVVGVPATIDNDVYGTDYCIGFDTAINTALEAIDRIRDTAESLERPFFVEVMGRKSGFIALEVGMAGGAEEIITPETGVDIERLCHSLASSLERGKKSIIVVVAEGAAEGGAMAIARQVGERLRVEYRVSVLGHTQRGGSPTARDRVLASTLGAAAVDAVAQGKTNILVGEVNGHITHTPLPETWQRAKSLAKAQLELVTALAA